MSTRERVVCPHCNHEYTCDEMSLSDNDLWVVAPNEDTVDEVCPHCHESFVVRGSYIPEYEMFKTEDDMD